MPDEAKLYLYDISEPDPNVLSFDKWENIYSQIQDTPLMGERDQRFGFIENIIHKQMIGGFFISEGLKQAKQYNDNKELLGLNLMPSFEQIFYVIFTDTSQVLLQHRNVYGYTNLGIGKIRDNFVVALSLFMQKSGIYITNSEIKLEKAGEEYSQEELFSYFIGNKIFGLEVRNINFENRKKIPKEQLKLYNPREELEELTWVAMQETIEKSKVNRAIFETNEVDEKPLLNKGPIIKAFAAVGEIQEIKAYENDGRILIRKKSGEEEFIISIPSEPSVSIPILDFIFDRTQERNRTQTWEKRIDRKRQQQLKGTLFDDGEQSGPKD